MAAIVADPCRSTGMKKQYHKTAPVQGVLVTQPLSWIQKRVHMEAPKFMAHTLGRLQ